MTKHTTHLPKFIVYQPDPKVFHICLEVGNIYYVWLSSYPPTQDNRFARRVKQLKTILPAKVPAKQIYDQGTYTVNKGDDKAAVAKKMKQGVKAKSFSFILDGKRLKGRFMIKQTSGGTMLQKFKDKFAVEEDIFSEDLSRSISLMVPGYDPSKVKLNYPRERKQPAKHKQEDVTPETEAEPEAITDEKKIGKTTFHFDLYYSGNGPDLYVISNNKEQVLILQKDGDHWKLLKPVKDVALNNVTQLAAHAKALYMLNEQ